jgi:hypothetical protein
MTQPFDSNHSTPPAPTIPGQSRQQQANRKQRPVVRRREFALIVLCLVSSLIIVGFTTWASNAWFAATGRTILASPLGQIAPPRTVHVSGNREHLILKTALGDMIAQEGLLIPFDPDTGHVRFDIVPWEKASTAPAQGCRGLIRATCASGQMVGDAWVSVQWSGPVRASEDEMRDLTKTIIARWQTQAEINSPLIRKD